MLRGVMETIIPYRYSYGYLHYLVATLHNTATSRYLKFTLDYAIGTVFISA